MYIPTILLQQLQQNASKCSWCIQHVSFACNFKNHYFCFDSRTGRREVISAVWQKRIYLFLFARNISPGRTIQFPLKTRRLSVRFICPSSVVPTLTTVITTRATIIITVSGGGVVSKTKYCLTRRVVSYDEIKRKPFHYTPGWSCHLFSLYIVFVAQYVTMH